MDVDKFKEVNDVYGHTVGDAVLHTFRRTAETDSSVENDIVGRIGGDEFTVLMWNVTAVVRQSEAKAEKLLAGDEEACI